MNEYLLKIAVKNAVSEAMNDMKLSRVQYKEKGAGSWVDVETMEEDDALKYIKYEQNKYRDREYRIHKY